MNLALAMTAALLGTFPPGGAVVLKATAFAPATSTVTPEAQEELKGIVQQIQAWGAMDVVTERVTEDADEKDHPGIGGERAQALRSVLAADGVPAAALSWVALPPAEGAHPVEIHLVPARTRVFAATRAPADARLRPSDQPEMPLVLGAPVLVGDQVSGGASMERVRLELLNGGGRVQLDPSATVRVELGAPATQIWLPSGAVEVTLPSGAAAVTVRTPAADVHVASGVTRVEVSPEGTHAVTYRGTATATGRVGDPMNLTAGQSAKLGLLAPPVEADLAPAPIPLSPLRGVAPASFSVQLAGQMPARVEIARDADFDLPATSVDAPQGSASATLDPGTYFWRAVSMGAGGMAGQRSAEFSVTVGAGAAPSSAVVPPAAAPTPAPATP